MTVLAGVWRLAEPAGSVEADGIARAMLDAQFERLERPSRTIVEAHGQGRVAFACAKPDGTGPAQPEGDARATDPLVVADARIDNRPELLAALGLRRGHPIDDAGLIALGYTRWGEGIVDHLLGDYAIACWDAGREALVLIRDPTGQRPLHYHRGDGFVAFASMPRGLLALDGVGRELDRGALTSFVADAPVAEATSFFRDVARVEPAQLVRVTRHGARARRYWAMPDRELRFRRDADYAEAFREQLDRAVAVRLPGGGGTVAAHLSAGLDSGAVAATAARLAAAGGATLLAITSAPRAGFAGPAPAGRIADETGPAAAVAGMHPNMEHLVLRSASASPLDLLDADAALFGQPVGHPCNNVWWRAANAVARERGASVLLTGEMGNLSISAGGLGVLSDHVRAGRWRTWAREAAALAGTGPRWRGLLAASFGPWLPRGALAALGRLAAGGRPSGAALFVADPAARRTLASAARGHDVFGRSDRESRWDQLRHFDPGNFRKGTLLRWGIDERDPTADRRLIEFCFALPPEQLVGGGRTRRLARTALADRLPDAVLHGARGYQYADWYEALDRDRLARFADRVAASPDAAKVIDFGLVHRLIADWPPADWASARTIGAYRLGLLRALSAGAFALNAAA